MYGLVMSIKFIPILNHITCSFVMGLIYAVEKT